MAYATKNTKGKTETGVMQDPLSCVDIGRKTGNAKCENRQEVSQKRRLGSQCLPQSNPTFSFSPQKHDEALVLLDVLPERLDHGLQSNVRWRCLLFLPPTNMWSLSSRDHNNKHPIGTGSVPVAADHRRHAFLEPPVWPQGSSYVPILGIGFTYWA